MKKNKRFIQPVLFAVIIFAVVCGGWAADTDWTVVDTGQDKCYNANGQPTTCPGEGSAFHGQDSQYDGAQPGFTDNGDGTITDNNTGLMWQKTPGAKVTWAQASAGASSFSLAGHNDWRLPTIKELYSLIDFSGLTGTSAQDSIPFIDTDYFVFNYGDTSAGERFIDAQYCSSTQYAGATMGGNATIFGVNFADGRIKGYPKENKTYYVMYVRGSTGYGTNRFVDYGDGTVTDTASGLMWTQGDSGHLNAGNGGKLNWEQALDWAEDLDYAGHSDWRLPNAKELQALVDYTRSPDTTNSPAIDPIFNTTSIIDGNGQTNYPYYWTGTTHKEGSNSNSGLKAVYIAFGEAQGYMQPPGGGGYTLMDVHGAGAQRSDFKKGDPDDYPHGVGPQGDVVTIYNFVRCVRDAGDDNGGGGEEEEAEIQLNRTAFYFSAIRNGSASPSQTLMIENIGDGTLNWTVSTNASWLSVSQSSGSGNGMIDVSVGSGGLSAGTYTGTVSVYASNASNSPQQATVMLRVLTASEDTPPIGAFDSPAGGAVVSSSIPVTGWALDDVGIASVTIYAEQNGTQYAIGQGLLVEGARPDIEAAYAQYPAAYKAGWGYMMLTNGLPGGGNGTWKITAVATDVSGNTLNLGSKTISVDNVAAVKPFGAIDAPAPGALISGGSYQSNGWVLTPLPNKIPEDGSTLRAYIDGQYIGQPIYNIYRSDIADFFPGYANSSGAAASMIIDTTQYENGIHTLSWSAVDNAGNTDGIGSRYFTIFNSGSSSRTGSSALPRLAETRETRVNQSQPVKIIKGFAGDAQPQVVTPSGTGEVFIDINPLERVELHLPHQDDGTGNSCSGYLETGGELRPLPVGSSLDAGKEIFYWQPGLGFMGNYELVFITVSSTGEPILTRITVRIAHH